MRPRFWVINFFNKASKCVKFCISHTYNEIHNGAEIYRNWSTILYGSHTTDLVRYEILGNKSVRKPTENVKLGILNTKNIVAENHHRFVKILELTFLIRKYQ